MLQVNAQNLNVSCISIQIILGALLDTYLVTHNKDLFPYVKYKVHTVIKEDSLSYGAVVNDKALASCLSYLLARDKYSVYEVIQKQLKDPLKVRF